MTEQNSSTAEAGRANGARAIVEVTAGVIPEKPQSEHTRRWSLSTSQWDDATDKTAMLAQMNGTAMGYAMLLMVQPIHVNWVRLDWIWV